MAKKRRKKQRKSSGGGQGASARGSSGGVMQSLRSGFKRAAGAGDETQKASTVSNILWTVFLLAALGYAIYNWVGR